MAGGKRSKGASRGSRASPKKKQFTQKQLAQFRASMAKGILMPKVFDAQLAPPGDDSDSTS